MTNALAKPAPLPVDTERSALEALVDAPFALILVFIGSRQHKIYRSNECRHLWRTIDFSKVGPDQTEFVYGLDMNRNGINLSDGGIELARDLTFLNEGNVKLAGFAESNIDWTFPGMRKKFSDGVRRAWQHCGVATSSSGIPSKRGFQPGGTATIVNGRWTGRAVEKYADPLAELLPCTTVSSPTMWEYLSTTTRRRCLKQIQRNYCQWHRGSSTPNLRRKRRTI